MNIWSTCILLSLLCACAAHGETVKPNLPDGYANFQWGTERAIVLEAVSGAREVADGKLQRLEKKVLGARSSRTKVGATSKARRLSSFRFWKQMGGLPARVELKFFDDVLYGATVHVLFRRKDRRKVAVLYDALLAKYGAPQPSSEDAMPMQERQVLRFGLADGFLEVKKLEPRGKHRGLFRFRYRSDSLGTQVDEYHARLEATLVDLQESATHRKQEAARKRSEQAVKRLGDQL